MSLGIWKGWDMTSKRTWLPFGALLLAVVCLAASVDAQEKSDVKAEAKKPDAVERKKPRGRLPNHYSDVVTGEQKDKIYDIQGPYLSKIEKLADEIMALRSQMAQDVEAVLTPEQKQRVAALKAEADAKRKAVAEAKAKELNATPPPKRSSDTGKTQVVPAEKTEKAAE